MRGCPKSGRVWKTTQKAKGSTIKRGAGHNSSWERKMRRATAEKTVKAVHAEIKDGLKQAKLDKKERRLVQEQRRKDNEKKAEIVQEIKNTHKLKRAKKKHLRTIEKRDTTVVDKS